MKITDILTTACIRVPVAATDKAGVIAELVDVLDAAGRLSDRDAVLKSVVAREATRSTGVGNGLAVPHGKSAGCAALAMAIGKPATPLDFDSSDGAPVELVVLLASPIDEMGPHIQALARVSRVWLAPGFRAAVAAAASPDELYAAIERYQG
ncbi:MAG: PTS sugar transporter subunit IIA [Phycisphaerae bacterium]